MATLTLHHDEEFELVPDEAGEIAQFHAASGETRMYRADTKAVEGGTTVMRFPADYDATPVALLHLVQSTTARHVPVDAIHSVSGDDAGLVAKLAALLDAEVIA